MGNKENREVGQPSSELTLEQKTARSFWAKSSILAKAGVPVTAILIFASTSCFPSSGVQEAKTPTPELPYKITLESTVTKGESIPTPVPTVTAEAQPTPTKIPELTPVPERGVIQPYDVYLGELFEVSPSGIRENRGTIAVSLVHWNKGKGDFVVILGVRKVLCPDGKIHSVGFRCLFPYQEIEEGKYFSVGMSETRLNASLTEPGLLGGDFKWPDSRLQEAGVCKFGTVLFWAKIQGNGREALGRAYIKAFEEEPELAILPSTAARSPEAAMENLEQVLGAKLL